MNGIESAVAVLEAKIDELTIKIDKFELLLSTKCERYDKMAVEFTLLKWFGATVTGTLIIVVIKVFFGVR